MQQFSSKEHRDRWIDKELQSLQQSAQQKEQQVEDDTVSCSSSYHLYPLLYVSIVVTHKLPFACSVLYIDPADAGRHSSVEGKGS